MTTGSSKLRALHSWREAWTVYTQGRVLAMLSLGFAAGLPFLLVFSTLTAWLTEAGVSRTTIGFFSWVGITYSIKVFWAPVVDRLRLPCLHRWLGQRRSWMFIAQVGIAVGLVAMALTDPQTQLQQVALCALLVAFSSATQDVSVDAFRIESADEEYQAAMSAAYVFGYRLALLVAGAGAFYIAEYNSWSVAYISMAALMGIGMVTVLLVREPVRETETLRSPVAKSNLVDAVVGPFRDFFARQGWFALIILLLIAVYRISDITMGVMANPFYLDMGYTKVEIADVTKVFGFAMLMLGAFLGGVFVTRWGTLPILLLGAASVAATNLLFAMLAGIAEPSLTLLALVVSADNLCGGLATVAFIAYLSGLTNKAYTATQYALFSSLMTLPGKFIGGFSGWLVDASGYVWFFTFAAAMGIPAVLLCLWLLLRQRRLDRH
ncbi:MAG: AmpG family muropeptide MFS transporter [Oleiphilaceae bacterium]|nr:AmpG family muropeptide MFS transporter [Oleiphilaceae bacterium]